MKNYTNGVNTKLLSEKAYDVIYKNQGYVPVEDFEAQEEAQEEAQDEELKEGAKDDGADAKKRNRGKNKEEA